MTTNPVTAGHWQMTCELASQFVRMMQNGCAPDIQEQMRTELQTFLDASPLDNVDALQRFQLLSLKISKIYNSTCSSG
jgi:hypothetical protein